MAAIRQTAVVSGGQVLMCQLCGHYSKEQLEDKTKKRIQLVWNISIKQGDIPW